MQCPSHKQKNYKASETTIFLNATNTLIKIVHQFAMVYHSKQASEVILFVLKQNNEVQHKVEGVSYII